MGKGLSEPLLGGVRKWGSHPPDWAMCRCKGSEEGVWLGPRNGEVEWRVVVKPVRVGRGVRGGATAQSAESKEEKDRGAGGGQGSLTCQGSAPVKDKQIDRKRDTEEER